MEENKIQELLEKVVTKTNDLLEEKLQRIENKIEIEINEIQVKIHNDLDIANLKETVNNIVEVHTFISREFESQKQRIK